MMDKFRSKEAQEEPKHKYHLLGDNDYSIMAAVSYGRWRGRTKQLIACAEWRTMIVL
jgi:hypothetical protein